MQLAGRLAGNADYAPLMSFAGRTAQLRLPPIPYRIGGFGGAEGLGSVLQAQQFAAVVDATHPFATRMSTNAAVACGRCHVPLAVFTRPAWKRVKGDDWIEVESFAAALDALGTEPRTVFLAIGRQELAAFRQGTPHRYTVRTVDPVDPDLLPVGASLIQARGPFDEAAELQLLQDRNIEIVVSKNSGGDATYAKIAAARELGLPVVIVRRPPPAAEGELHDVDAVLAWLEALRLRAHGATP